MEHKNAQGNCVKNNLNSTYLKDTKTNNKGGQLYKDRNCDVLKPTRSSQMIVELKRSTLNTQLSEILVKEY